ncbi:MAG: acyl-CoA dehydrogenase family protein [Acidobacteriota bacterium]|nr:acyl-CoA dehydrogenase family protein [Acidobacteriota bacterium]
MTDGKRKTPSPIDDPALLPYLPMLYVAWADGDLEPSEIRSICRTLTEAQDDEKQCRDLLGSWLDPDQPPSADSLQAMLGAIRTRSADLPDTDRIGLADLGVELARTGGREVSASERRALEEIEDALGIAGTEVSQLILFPARPSETAEEPGPAFDVAAMTRLLDGEYEEIRNRMRELLRQPEFRYEYGLDRAAYRERVLEWARRLAAEGIGALSYPEAQGGAGDMLSFIAAFETLATHDGSLLVKCGVQFGLFGGSILQLGTQRHHEQYLRVVGSLELPGGFAMTETGHGSNVYDLRTTARFDRGTGEFVIDTPDDAARKDYIGNAALHGKLMTVFAQLEIDGEGYGVHAFLVPVRGDDGRVLPGVRIEDCGEKLGLNGVDNGRLWFDGVRVPRENLLNRFAEVSVDGGYSSPIASPSKRFFTMLGTLVGGRVSVALGAHSAAKSALTIAVRYATRRRQFGPAGAPETVLLDYLTHQRRLLPRLATTYALDFALKHLANEYQEGSDDDRREVEALAAGLKAFSTWHTTDTIQICREACGGQGYLAVNRFAALKADTDVFSTFEGDNIVLMQLLAKGLLTGYKRQFGGMGLLRLARYVAGQTATTVAELNPVVTRNTDESHLRSRDFQLPAFRWRADHLLSTLARRLKKRLDDGMDPFEALVAVQDHAVATARAHTERVILEQFWAGIERCEDPDLAEALVGLADLFALYRIELDRGWFQEHGYLEASKAKAIRKTVNKLCCQIRPQALHLVNGFGIPDELLGAPIAT